MIIEDAKIVDFHVHVFPDGVAERALQTLTQTYNRTPVTDATRDGLLAHMAKSGVSFSVIQPVATKPSQVRSINDWASSHCDPRLISFGSVHPEYDDVPGEVERIISLGLPGLKIQSCWMGQYVDDPIMFPMYEAARGRLIITFHSGDELVHFEDLMATPRRLANVHRQFPDLTMICAHMGGYKMWDEVEEFLLGTGVYLDTSACFPAEMPDERLLSMIRRHGVDRVVFATDSPFGDACNDIPRLLGLGLTDDEIERVFWRNAEVLLGDRLNSALASS